MHEFSKPSFVVQRIRDRGDAIDDKALDSPLLDSTANRREEDVDLHFERRYMEQMDGAALNVPAQGQTERIGVSQHLGRMFIRAHEQRWLAQFLGCFGGELVAKNRFASTGVPNDERHGSVVDTAAAQLIERVISDRRSLEFGRRWYKTRTRVRLHAPKHLETFAVRDVERVLALVEPLPTTFGDFETPEHAAVMPPPMQVNHGVGENLGGFQRQQTLAVRARFVRQ
jgi:hypothetical protein